MGGVTYADLVNYAGLVQDSADSWADLLAGVNANADYLRDHVSQPVGQAWTGTAAELFSGKVDKTHGGLIETVGNIQKVKGILEEFNTKMLSYRNQLRQLVDHIETDGILPDSQGSVGAKKWAVDSNTGQVGISSKWHPPSDYTSADGQKDLVTQKALQEDIQAILDNANTEDDNTAKALRALLKAPAALAPTTDTVENWTTVSTDGSLWQIAEKEYGNGNLWTKIYDANKATIGSNPNLIQPGMKLKIPALNTAGTPHVQPGSNWAPPPTATNTGTPRKPAPSPQTSSPSTPDVVPGI
jgi:LysM domain